MSRKDKYVDGSGEEPLSLRESIRATGTVFTKNRKKKLKAALIALLCIVIVVVAMGGAYISRLLGLVRRDDHTGDPNATFAAENEDYKNASPISDIRANSVDQYCIQWATTGEKLRGSRIINILLLGLDSAEDATNSDTIIIASINTEKKTITLCSVMRDSYTYINVDGSARCDKINHAYPWSGAQSIKTTLENDLKIVIDHYVSVDFEGFKAMIDELGGIDVKVTEAEASFMNATTKIKGFDFGDSVHLDGEHALVFARIRKLDSDIERTGRQRLVIEAILNKFKNSSAAQINNLVNRFLPFVTTDCSNKSIISYGTRAISDGWLKYDIHQLTEPGEEDRLEAMMTTYSSQKTKQFVWIVDWAKVAHEVQQAFYGLSNIEIDEENHMSPIDIALGRVPASSTQSYSYDYNNTTSYYSTYEDETDEGFFGRDFNYSWSMPDIFNRENYTGRISDFTRYSTTRRQETTTGEAVTEPSSEATTRSRFFRETTTRETTSRRNITRQTTTRSPLTRETASSQTVSKETVSRETVSRETTTRRAQNHTTPSARTTRPGMTTRAR